MPKDNRPVGKVRGEYRDPKRINIKDSGVQYQPGLLEKMRDYIRKVSK